MPPLPNNTRVLNCQNVLVKGKNEHLFLLLPVGSDQSKWSDFEFDSGFSSPWMGFNSGIKVTDSHVHTKLPLSQWTLVLISTIQTTKFPDNGNGKEKEITVLILKQIRDNLFWSHF